MRRSKKILQGNNALSTLRVVIIFELNEQQRQKIADLCGDIGTVGFASVFLRFLFDSFDTSLAVLGMLFAIVCWAASLIFLRKI